MDSRTIERYGIFEIRFPGKTEGNPFTDYRIAGTFEGPGEQKTVHGFYDGDGEYVLRFMPSAEGVYRYRAAGSFSDREYEGTFEVTAAAPGQHGPVRVRNTFHFAYDDGTPYYSAGTTCYVWELQHDARIAETLESLKASGFNKIRFCIFPKHYLYNLKEPRSYPFPGTPADSGPVSADNFMEYDCRTSGNDWDFTRFNPEHFRQIERCIRVLRDAGIEADLIVFHPYDRWGFSCLPRDAEFRYLEYIINRFAAFSNVWWAMANEYDILPDRTDDVWNAYGRYFAENDPYGHLRSIHHCLRIFDHSADWITHVSYQRTDLYRTAEETDLLRARYGKPVVLDEIAYEGNIPCGWGNIRGEEMVRRFWEGAMRGGYPGHGETILTGETDGKDPVLWWSHGGKLRGESWKRVRFLLKILSETPGHGLKRKTIEWDCTTAVPEDDAAAEETGYRIDYFSFMCPSSRTYDMKDGGAWAAEVIDTWNMTAEPAGTFAGKFTVPLPGRPYMAIRLRRRREGTIDALQAHMIE